MSSGSPAPIPSFGAEQHARLADLVGELKALHGELAETVMAERRGRVEAYALSDETSVQARDREADSIVLDLSLDIIRLKADIAALTTEYTFLLDWMNVAPI